MKKEYKAPEAEKLVFDYTETVVASESTIVYNDDHYAQYYKCNSNSYYTGCVQFSD